jgi:5'-3' exonuclease
MSYTAYVDGDTFKWRYAAAGEYSMYFLSDGKEIRGKKNTKKYLQENPDVFVDHYEDVLDPVENVLHSVKLAMEDIQQVTKCKKPVVYIGEGTTFRHKLYNLYKFSRVDATKPTHYNSVNEYLISVWGAELVHDIEADDALSIAVTENPKSVLCSQDKDLLQVPGNHYNFVTKEKLQISPKQGDFNLFTQIISGDPTDDIPGIPGLGPAKAAKVLEGCTSSAELYSATSRAFPSEEEFLVGAQLVFMLRKPDQDFQQWCRGRGIL